MWLRVLAEGLITKKKSAWFAHSIPFGPQNEQPKGFFDWTPRSVPAKHLRFSKNSWSYVWCFGRLASNFACLWHLWPAGRKKLQVLGKLLISWLVSCLAEGQGQRWRRRAGMGQDKENFNKILAIIASTKQDRSNSFNVMLSRSIWTLKIFKKLTTKIHRICFRPF